MLGWLLVGALIVFGPETLPDIGRRMREVGVARESDVAGAVCWVAVRG